jgi:DNA-binding transcriptional MerR regulator
MPLSSSRDYLSIGEVLESVRPDFPEVSISKIRFLESEGLIAPERTQSGYRKFYENDVARLRYILSLQRDQFLPLRVIRERLASVDRNGGTLPADGSSGPPPSSAEPSRAPAGATAAFDHPAEEQELEGASGPAPAPMTRAELLEAVGLDEQRARGLEDFGLLRRADSYDRDDVAALTAAVTLSEFGVEPRHLRMFLQSAQREAAFVEQIVAPVTKRRDPDALAEAAATATRLVGLCKQLREALLRSSLRDSLPYL